MAIMVGEAYTSPTLSTTRFRLELTLDALLASDPCARIALHEAHIVTLWRLGGIWLRVRSSSPSSARMTSWRPPAPSSSKKPSVSPSHCPPPPPPPRLSLGMTPLTNFDALERAIRDADTLTYQKKREG